MSLDHIMNKDEEEFSKEYAKTHSMHHKAIALLTPGKKLGYFRDNVRRVRDLNGVEVTSVPFKAFYWMMLQCGGLNEALVADNLRSFAGLQKQGNDSDAGANAFEINKIRVQRSKGDRNPITPEELLLKISNGEVNYLSYERLMRVAENNAREGVNSLKHMVFKYLVRQDPRVNDISITPKKYYVNAEEYAITSGWMDKHKMTPYIFLNLRVDSLVASMNFWIENASVAWLWTKNRTKFILDDYSKVNASEYVVPACLTAIEMLAGPNHQITKFRTEVLISVCKKMKKQQEEALKGKKAEMGTKS